MCGSQFEVAIQMQIVNVEQPQQPQLALPASGPGPLPENQVLAVGSAVDVKGTEGTERARPEVEGLQECRVGNQSEVEGSKTKVEQERDKGDNEGI